MRPLPKHLIPEAVSALIIQDELSDQSNPYFVDLQIEALRTAGTLAIALVPNLLSAARALRPDGQEQPTELELRLTEELSAGVVPKGYTDMVISALAIVNLIAGNEGEALTFNQNIIKALVNEHPLSQIELKHCISCVESLISPEVKYPWFSAPLEWQCLLHLRDQQMTHAESWKHYV